MKIAINGFGRIGRAAFKIALDEGVEVAAINDLTDTKTLFHLLRYDSVYKLWNKKADYDDKSITIDDKKIPIFAEKDPAKLPWADLGIDVVLECTGVFTDGEKCKAHLDAGAKKVIISAPAKDEMTPTYVIGVNEKEYKDEPIISMASCTTNCIAPITKVLEDNFGIAKALMTTTHAYTADQNLVDGPHKDLRRARSAAINIVPTTTGAAIATTKTIPSLAGKFDGLSIRVPVACGSIADTTYLLKKKTSKEEINNLFKSLKDDKTMFKIMMVTDEELVSSDIIGLPFSTIIDENLTQVTDGDMVKIVAWYDNEWGYSNRLVEMAEYIGGR